MKFYLRKGRVENMNFKRNEFFKNDFFRKNRNYDIVLLLLCIAVTVFMLCSYNFLPENTPMQFSHDGSVNYTAPKIILCVILPLSYIAACLYYRWKKSVTQYILVLLIIVALLYFGFVSYILFNF